MGFNFLFINIFEETSGLNVLLFLGGWTIILAVTLFCILFILSSILQSSYRRKELAKNLAYVLFPLILLNIFFNKELIAMNAYLTESSFGINYLEWINLIIGVVLLLSFFIRNPESLTNFKVHTRHFDLGYFIPFQITFILAISGIIFPIPDIWVLVAILIVISVVPILIEGWHKFDTLFAFLFISFLIFSNFTFFSEGELSNMEILVYVSLFNSICLLLFGVLLNQIKKHFSYQHLLTDFFTSNFVMKWPMYVCISIILMALVVALFINVIQSLWPLIALILLVSLSGNTNLYSETEPIKQRDENPKKYKNKILVNNNFSKENYTKEINEGMSTSNKAPYKVMKNAGGNNWVKIFEGDYNKCQWFVSTQRGQCRVEPNN